MSRGYGKTQRKILEVFKDKRKIEKIGDLAQAVYFPKSKSNTRKYTRSQYITVYNALQKLIQGGAVGIEFE